VAQGWRVLPESAREFALIHSVLPCEDPASGVRIDLIFSFTPYEQHALERARTVMFGEVPVRFATPEDVIIHKIVAGRPRDLEDVRWIIKKNRELDLADIRFWLKQFQEALDQPLIDRLNSVL
jgi:hypothetical protein